MGRSWGAFLAASPASSRQGSDCSMLRLRMTGAQARPIPWAICLPMSSPEFLTPDRQPARAFARPRQSGLGSMRVMPTGSRSARRACRNGRSPIFFPRRAAVPRGTKKIGDRPSSAALRPSGSRRPGTAKRGACRRGSAPTKHKDPRHDRHPRPRHPTRKRRLQGPAAHPQLPGRHSRRQRLCATGLGPPIRTTG